MFPEINQLFWNDVWSSIISSLIISFFLAFLLAKIIRNHHVPRLHVAVSIGHGGNNQKHLSFVLENHGKQGYMPNEVEWFIYFEDHFIPKDQFLNEVGIDGSLFHMEKGFIQEPIHPGSSIELIGVPVNITEGFPYEWLDEAKFYCAMTTKNGKWSPYQSWFGKRNKKIIFDDGHLNQNLYKVIRAFQ